MTDSKEKPKSEFRRLYESLDLEIRDVIDITGTQRRAMELWEKEGVVKNEAALVLFKITEVLQQEPHFYTKSDVRELLFKAAGKENPYKNEDNSGDRLKQLKSRLKSIMSQIDEE